MKTKHYINIFVVILTVGFLAGCKKDFLDRIPETTITPNEFFKTTADLETYTNGFYGMFGAGTNDLFSDNISVYLGGHELDNMIRGKITPANVGGWSWGNLRTINYMLNNLKNVTGDAAAIKHFVGIARFYRGIFYYNMIRRYGDVPYYNTVLGTNDETQLYKAKDPRTLVADSVLADLEYAAANVLPTGTNTRVTKWAALTVLSRFCLYEGTFRKYHDELGLQSSATTFLQRAASAAKTVMTDGGFSIYNTGKKGEDYQKLFTSEDLSGNKEIIFYDDYNRALNRSNDTHYVFDWQWALSKSLVDTYLMTDGTAFTSTTDWDKKPYSEIFKNRDARMAVTVAPPGFSTTLGGAASKTRPTFGGYPQIKFYAIDPATKVNTEFTDLPILRYAEVLLISAEANAELGTLSQADLDQTINLLRNRAGVAPLNMVTANASPDNVLAAMYPAVNGINKGVILEIRRERNVELACEGFRFADLLRWKAGKLLEKPTQGMYVAKLGAYDVTGDGVEDVAILQAAGQETPLDGLPADVKAKLVKYYLSDNSFYLSNGTSGFIMFPENQTTPRSFIEPKYYYFPIPMQQILLNPQLKQPTGW